MSKRKSISKKVRFEVFKRDSFTCQYCGKSSPEVILNADHIKPVSKGGDNSILNLVTACFDCNSGKSDRELSDSSALDKQKQQLDELNARREQLELMIEWRESLKNIDSDASQALSNDWTGLTCDRYRLTESAVRDISKLLKKHSYIEISEAMQTASEQYFVDGDNGIYTSESVDKGFNKVPGILRNKNRPQYIQDIYYIRGILRNRLNYITEYQVIKAMEDAYQFGISIDRIKEISKDCYNEHNFYELLDTAKELG